MSDIMINGNNGVSTEFLSASTMINNIIWTDGEYCYQISGNERKEFILQLAESIE